MTTIASFSYATAALAFLLLSVLLSTTWRGRAHGRVLVLASAITAGSNALLAWEALHPIQWSVATDSVEILRNGAWSAFLIILLGHFEDKDSKLPFRLRPSLALIIAFYVLFFGATLLGYFRLELVSESGLMPGVAGRMGMAVLGMLLVEQLYRNKPEQERWAIKFACLGIGAMFAYDFYLYSDAMLFHKVNADIWAARGAVNALTVPLIAVSVVRSASWSAELAVSRRVMFHSAALFGSAIYLLTMGSAGYYLRYFGGSWGSVMQVTFLFGAVILLLGILFSGSFRAWLRVFISKHFYSYNYDYREEWLRFTSTLSKPGPGLGDRAVQAVGALVESSAGLMWIRRESGLFEPAANWQVAPAMVSEPADSPFCQFLDSKEWVVDLQEYEEWPSKYDDVAMPAWLQAYPRGWLVVPLMMQGRLFGFMLLMQPRSAIKLNWEVIDLLKIAGNQAASYLAQYEAANALMVARQFESFNRMSTFVVHDLKNLVSQLSLLMSNAERHKHNPEFQNDMIETVNFSVQKMKLLLQKLSRTVTPENPVALPIERLLRQAVAMKGGFEPQPALTVADAGLTVRADWERLERVVGHLIQNAIEATARDGRVEIGLARRGESVLIRITDNGEGMSEDFIRERLFKPFESTKSAGMGIGAFESQEYIEELGGTLEVTSERGRGSTFTIILPLLKQERQDAHTLNQAA
ncbi:PEP-CTERM system histidine kinase PrsK [Massilia eurypsychrophila]|uniref:histidine kinase n=1 Tax=Massilia eurypsychrophila TaxID=1485217 RepID=A0A2G8TLM5_9BURK|nr:XrtA/PEP-CTERM system histidine kinase PrsK [Massilia eurypsychrophila]PIL46960.1 PEP-CTERM system histidine kinase PrsK [Massilia eurypsychrophila]